MKYRVFIDGAEGTTGLKIHQYFQMRDDIDLITIDKDRRKDPEERLTMIKKADISFLCLPDAAAREIAAAAPADARILDTSTAHRTSQEWVYGMPELCPQQRQRIKDSNRVAVPGCHATGVILLIKPLLEIGLAPHDYSFSAFSLTGYSGGGKKMIAQYESEERIRGNAGHQDILCSPRQYGISQSHKHLPEIMAVTGLASAPAFMPVVGDYYSGMEVTIPLSVKGLRKEDVRKAMAEYYRGQPLIEVSESTDDSGFIAAGRLSGTNKMEIAVHGSDDNIILVATYDNLGKGASGAAVQNMNIMLGIEETKGLI